MQERRQQILMQGRQLRILMQVHQLQLKHRTHMQAHQLVLAHMRVPLETLTQEHQQLLDTAVICRILYKLPICLCLLILNNLHMHQECRLDITRMLLCKPLRILVIHNILLAHPRNNIQDILHNNQDHHNISHILVNRANSRNGDNKESAYPD